MYDSIGRILDCFVPLFDRVLNSIAGPVSEADLRWIGILLACYPTECSFQHKQSCITCLTRSRSEAERCK